MAAPDVDTLSEALTAPSLHVNPIVDPIYNYEIIDAKIAYYAEKWGQSYSEMYRVVKCETAGTFDPTIQSFAYYTEDHPEWGVMAGDRELSFGLVQIHRPAHDIVHELVIDPDFALDWMGKQWYNGNQSWWTCY